MDYRTTILLEQGMAVNRQRIERAWRCEVCDGTGQMRVGCAITHAVYWPCLQCAATGRKLDWDALHELFTAVRLEALYEQALADGRVKADQEHGRDWVLVTNKR